MYALTLSLPWCVGSPAEEGPYLISVPNSEGKIHFTDPEEAASLMSGI